MYFQVQEVLSSTFDDEEVLLDLRRGVYFSLNRVGKEIWHLLGEGCSPTTIIDRIQGRYKVDREIVVHDVERLVEDLLLEDLISCAE